ncbi:PapB/FocB family fimbrial expression transcriptional regulator [Vibrio casei]|uniref:PapB/FocB family fimbrial expression transcriptional regulator n=1 Tax=Vibrio casei TaxID=673372 RepID=UPI003F95EC52
MNYLLCGGESKRRVEILLELTSISSEPIIKAIHRYLVDGYSESELRDIFGISQSNFNRALKKLNNVAELIEEVKDIDLNKSAK